VLFRNYIYVDGSLLEDLSKQIGIKIGNESVKTNQTNKKAGIGLSKITAGAEKIQTDTETLENDKYDLMKAFEQEVMKDDTGIVPFDFDEADHIFNGQLIQFTAKMLEPKGENNNFEIIKSIKQNPLFTSIAQESIDETDSSSKIVMDLILKNDNNNIPIYFSNDEKYIVVSKIDIKELNISYEDFQDLYEEEINVILLVNRKYSDDQDVIITDLMKDILKIGRDLRRTMAKEEQNKYIIKERRTSNTRTSFSNV